MGLELNSPPPSTHGSTGRCIGPGVWCSCRGPISCSCSQLLREMLLIQLKGYKLSTGRCIGPGVWCSCRGPSSCSCSQLLKDKRVLILVKGYNPKLGKSLQTQSLSTF